MKPTRVAIPGSAVRRLVAAFLGGWVLLPAAASAQTVRVAAEQEVFRQTPDGRRLGTVMRATELRAVGRQGAWTQVQLEGWIWSRSIARTNRNGFDLVVSAVGGENLREAPDGRIMARLLQGFLLQKVEEGEEWTRVRRTGWVWGPSLEAGPGGRAVEVPSAEGPPPGEPAPRERVIVAESGTQLRLSPEGDTVAILRPGADLEVVERRDRWARVRLEGWLPASEVTTSDPEADVADLSAADLRANPDQFRGRRVRWSVQFISLERAEPVRTDFYEGERFILARAPDPAHGFVYLAVPDRLLPDVEGLRGLETIEVLARVRTGRSALMGVPILDLLTLY